MSLLRDMFFDNVKGNTEILQLAQSRFEPLKQLFHMIVNREKIVHRWCIIFFSKDYVMDHSEELEIKYDVIDPTHIRVTINLEKGGYTGGYTHVWADDDVIRKEISAVVELSDLTPEDCFKSSVAINSIINKLALLDVKFRGGFNNLSQCVTCTNVP